MIKQSKWLNGNLKLGHKRPTIRTTIDLITEIERQTPTFWNEFAVIESKAWLTIVLLNRKNKLLTIRNLVT